MDDVQKALQYLPKEKVLGLVLNRSSSTRTAYYYDTKKQR
jgi:hypothetical protein